MAKSTSVGKRHGVARVRRNEDESWPEGELTAHAMDDPDIGVDASAFYRWRRNKSEPPPPLGPSGSGLAHYRRRDS